MSRTPLSSTILAAALLPSLWSASSMAQDAPAPDEPQPGFTAPPPPTYAPPTYASPAYAPQAYADPPGYHQYDGFYLRLLGGGGYLSNSFSGGGYTVKLSGAAATIGVAVGGAIVPDLIIYGEFLDTIASSPKMDINGQSGTASGSVDLIGFGPGLAYYLATNTYLSATLLFSKVQISDSKGNNTQNASDMGVGGSGTIGQEWWVSTDWGIGLAGQFTYASMKVGGVDARWSSYAASLLFSATYN